MNKTSLQRQAENEAVFRKANEAAEKGVNREYTKINDDDSTNSSSKNEDMRLHFFCECSDENCKERIVMTVGEYRKLHKNRNRFIVLPDHQVETIEKVIKTTDKHSVVEKFMSPPEEPSQLNTTTVNNN